MTHEEVCTARGNETWLVLDPNLPLTLVQAIFWDEKHGWIVRNEHGKALAWPNELRLATANELLSQ